MKPYTETTHGEDLLIAEFLERYTAIAHDEASALNDANVPQDDPQRILQIDQDLFNRLGRPQNLVICGLRVCEDPLSEFGDKRYRVVEGSDSAHCCFNYSVIDSASPRLCPESICECFYIEPAVQIARALNATI
jgi:hypothetical protein